MNTTNSDRYRPTGIVKTHRNGKEKPGRKHCEMCRKETVGDRLGKIMIISTYCLGESSDLAPETDPSIEEEMNMFSNPMVSPHTQTQEDIGEYVAQLQLHMTLQARNLIPHLHQGEDSRRQLLQETQAVFEKLASRQGLL